MKFSLIKKQNGSYIPAYDSDYEASKKVAIGDTVEAKVDSPRNIKYHRKFFALLNYVWENQIEIVNENTGEVSQQFKTVENLLDYVKIKSGHYEPYMIDDYEFRKPKSISFAKMNNLEFEQFYNNTFDVLKKIVEINEDELINFY